MHKRMEIISESDKVNILSKSAWKQELKEIQGRNRKMEVKHELTESIKDQGRNNVFKSMIATLKAP